MREQTGVAPAAPPTHPQWHSHFSLAQRNWTGNRDQFVSIYEFAAAHNLAGDEEAPAKQHWKEGGGVGGSTQACKRICDRVVMVLERMGGGTSGNEEAPGTNMNTHTYMYGCESNGRC